MAFSSRALPSIFRNAPRAHQGVFHRALLLQNSARNPSTTRVAVRSYATKPKGGETYGSKNAFPLFPLLAILAAGSGAFYYMIQSRKDPAPAIEKPRIPNTTTPKFSNDEALVIFVLGGPGVGKGTQCANLVRDYKFIHLSAGDLLREEQNREGSEYGELIKTYIQDGKIVPMEVTVALLENAMQNAIKTQGKFKFLIDGFPRKLDQAYKFEEDVCESRLTLFFDCTEDVMLKRLLKRAETSGRIDDNIESIKKRFNTFKETSYPVVEYFKSQGKVVNVDATKSREDVYAHVQKVLKDRLKPTEKV